MIEEFEGRVTTEESLRAIYKFPTPLAVAKEIGRLDIHSRKFIELSPFLCLSTSGPRGADVSPRGGAPGFVMVLDDTRLAIPDRPGNNRLDSLVNVLTHSEVGLIFFVPGFEDVLRVNGTACILTDQSLVNRFDREGKRPFSVLLVEVREAQMHCAKAIRRAGLWDENSKRKRESFPSLGTILHDQLSLQRDIKELDDSLEDRNRTTLY